MTYLINKQNTQNQYLQAFCGKNKLLCNQCASRMAEPTSPSWKVQVKISTGTNYEMKIKPNI